jgi:hypothetical protein
MYGDLDRIVAHALSWEETLLRKAKQISARKPFSDLRTSQRTPISSSTPIGNSIQPQGVAASAPT